MRSSFFMILAAALFAVGLSESAAEDYFAPVDEAPKPIRAGETLYVPVYSHIYGRGKEVRLLAATLSIRNTDPNQEIFVTGVHYYDTAGALVETFLDRPHRLAPLATAEFFIDQNDPRGGSGANFLVEWIAGAVVVPPIVEAVMVGTSGPQAMSFARNGRVIATHP